MKAIFHAQNHLQANLKVLVDQVSDHTNNKNKLIALCSELISL